ncbi:MAG: oxidoreductase [Nocardioidaceae bacterium]
MLTADDVRRWVGLEGVPSALVAARDAVDVLLRDRGLRRTTPELTAESLLRGAAASARLEGSASTLDDLRGGDGDPLALATARMNAALLALVPVVQRAPVQAIARLHTLAAAGLVDDGELGRPRPVDGAAARLHALSAVLLASTDVPAIAMAGIAHAELMTAAPFAMANGVVARGLERLLLVARGVDPTSMVVPEAGHLALEPVYRAALTAYAEGGEAGRRAWLLHVVQATATGVEASPLRSGTPRDTP